jgi:hypothetical protein
MNWSKFGRRVFVTAALLMVVGAVNFIRGMQPLLDVWFLLGALFTLVVVTAIDGIDSNSARDK